MAPWRLSSAHFMPDMAAPIGPLWAVLCRCRHKKPWLLLVEAQLRVLSTIYCVYEGDEVNTKSRGCGCRLRLGVDGGADSRKTSFPPCRLRHPHRHARHDDSRRDGIKSGPWP